MKCTLTSSQVEALKKRFASLDLRKEFVDARNWVENIHRGRPYKSFGRFFWNWCRRSEEESLRRSGRRRPAERVNWEKARVVETAGFFGFTDAELEEAGIEKQQV